MKVDLKTEEVKEYDVKYICADLNVRYWEDADINGEDDISYEEQEKGEKPRIPLAEENPDAEIFMFLANMHALTALHD